MKEFRLRADEIADLDPYNIRSKPVVTAAQDLLVPEQVEKDEIERFSEAQKDGLKRMGCRIIELKGESIDSLRQKGLDIGRTWIDDSIDVRTTIKREVAINGKALPTSEYKNLDQQLQLIQNYENEINKFLPEMGVVMGKVEEYAEIFYRDKDAFEFSGINLQIRTLTETEKDYSACFYKENDMELTFVYWKDDTMANIVAYPLIVPTHR